MLTPVGPELERLHLEMYRDELPSVRQALRRYGVAESDLPDLAQDVFIVAYRRLTSFDRSRPLRPWLLGIAFRVAIDHFRRSRHQREVPVAERPEAPDPEGGPDEALHQRQTRAVAEQALASLDSKHRAVLVMYELDDRPTGEIAAELSIPVKTVYTRLRVARERLADAATRILAGEDLVSAGGSEPGR